MCLNTGYQCKCLIDGDPCEPCRMTVKHRGAEEAHMSSNISVLGQAESTCEPETSLSSSSAVLKRRGRNWGWMVSGIICLNILILGCALVSGSVYNAVHISTAHLQIYLVILLLLTTAWMIYYAVYITKQKDAVMYKDAHAGPVWLRGKNNITFFINPEHGIPFYCIL